MKSARYAWIAASVAVLAISVFEFSRTGNAGVATFTLCAMLTLSFPSSLAVAAIIAGVVLLMEGSVQAESAGIGVLGICTLWSVFFIGGLLQWFWFAPWLVSRLSSLKIR